MSENGIYDLVIVGGGPGGLSAGVYAMRAALKTVLVEKGVPGGQVAGLLGSLLAVPIIASVRDVGVYVWRKLIDADPFPDEVAEPIASEP